MCRLKDLIRRGGGGGERRVIRGRFSDRRWDLIEG